MPLAITQNLLKVEPLFNHTSSALPNKKLQIKTKKSTAKTDDCQNCLNQAVHQRTVSVQEELVKTVCGVFKAKIKSRFNTSTP